jgi:hypothetical protein
MSIPVLYFPAVNGMYEAARYGTGLCVPQWILSSLPPAPFRIVFSIPFVDLKALLAPPARRTVTEDVTSEPLFSCTYDSDTCAHYVLCEEVSVELRRLRTGVSVMTIEPIEEQSDEVGKGMQRYMIWQFLYLLDRLYCDAQALANQAENFWASSEDVWPEEPQFGTEYQRERPLLTDARGSTGDNNMVPSYEEALCELRKLQSIPKFKPQHWVNVFRLYHLHLEPYGMRLQDLPKLINKSVDTVYREHSAWQQAYNKKLAKN